MKTPTFTGTSTTMMTMTMTSKKLTAPDHFNWTLHPHLTTQANKLKCSSFLKNRAGCPEPFLPKTIPDWRFFHEDEKRAILDRAREIIERRFPKVSFAKLGPIGFNKKGDEAKMASFGPKGGESDIFKKDDSGQL